MAASRSTSVEQAKSFSANPVDFVPKSFSGKSKEFVPRWERVHAEVAPAIAQASPASDTDDSSADERFCAKSAEFVPKTFTAKSTQFAPKPMSASLRNSQQSPASDTDDSSADERFCAKAAEFVPKMFTAKSTQFVPKPISAKSAEFVPKHLSVKMEQVAAANCNEVSLGDYSDVSGEETDDRDGCLESTTDEASDCANKHNHRAALKAKKLSSATLSTCVGSSSSLSADDVSSTASLTGTSRSHSPAPSFSAAAFGVHALLQWRHAATSNRPDDLALSVQEVEPEAAVASAEQSESEVCAEMADAPTLHHRSAAPLGVSALLQWRHASPFTRPNGLALSAEEVEPVSPEVAAAVLEETEPEVCAETSDAPALSAAPMGVNALLQWRYSIPSKRPDDLLLVAEEVEPVTPEAAVAIAVETTLEVCAEVSDAPTLSDFFSSKKPGLKKKKQAATASKDSEKFAAPAKEVQEVPVAEDFAAPTAEVESEKLTAPAKEVEVVPFVQEARPAQETLPAKALPAAERIAKTSRPDVDEQCWRNVDTVKKLEVSEVSFAAQMRARRTARSGTDSDKMSDKDVVRAMKSILNKLTVEKFDSLSTQLMQCGIHSAAHVEQLIEEVFEKATTQHHFINMYADLCALLSKQRIIEDTSINFKKILLNCCQASFEKNLTPPSGLAELNSEDRSTSELLYKMRMIGNIRFVGALLVRKMLASKVMLSIMEVLLQDPTPEALESLAAFLMVVGPSFDTVDWAYRATLNAVFAQIGKLVKKASVPSRIQCLLKDVLDIRSSGWKDMRPKKIEGPLKLDQVAAKAAVELSGGQWDASKLPSNSDDWAVVSGPRKAPSLSNMSTAPCTPVAPKAESISKTSDLFKKLRDKEESSKKEEAAKKAAKKERKEKKEAKREAAQFDKDAWRAELSATLDELRVSHEVPDAIARVADVGVPASHQPSELCDILSRITEEGSQDVRKLGFGLVTGLFLEKHWVPESAAQGLHMFLEDVCADLKYDVPTLPQILRDEMHPALAPLAQANLLDMDLHDSLTSTC